MTILLRRTFAAAITGAGLFAASTAAAQPMTAEPQPAPAAAQPDTADTQWKPISQQQRVGGDIWWWSAKGIGSALPVVPFVHVEVADNFYIDGQLPFVMAIDGPGDTTRAGLGNPTVGVHYAADMDPISWFVGGRLSAPLASIHDDDYRFANVLGSGAMALYDRYLWAVDYLPISLTAGAEYRVIDPVYIRGSIDPIFYIPTGSPRSVFLRGRNKFDFGLQTRVEGEARTEMGIGGGLALQMVVGSDGAVSPGDNAQLSLEPFFSYDDEETFFMRFGLLMALDTPLGFAFDRGGVFSPHFQAGVHLD